MSHVEASKAKPTDLDILREATALFPQLHWKENQKTYEWYRQWMNDYHGEHAAYKQGIDPKDYGKCEHAISVDGSAYEIGVCKRKDGQGYSLVWDFYGTGRNINKVIGDGAEKLMVEYQRLLCAKYATMAGCVTVETQDDENIYVTGWKGE